MKRFEYRAERKFQWLTTEGLNNIFTDWELIAITPIMIDQEPIGDGLQNLRQHPGFLYTFKRQLP